MCFLGILTHSLYCGYSIVSQKSHQVIPCVMEKQLLVLSGARGQGRDPKVSGSATDCLADLGPAPAPLLPFLVQRDRAIFHKYLPR